MISTVPVGFEVYNNHAHMVLNDSQVYVDEFEALKKQLETTVDNTLVDVNKQISQLLTDIQSTTNRRNDLDLMLKQWTQLVNDKAVALLNANNTFTEFVEFLKPVSGFMTGTTIPLFWANSEQQDLDDITVLRKQPVGTTTRTFYYGNKVKNNPINLDYLMLETHRVTDRLCYQMLYNNWGSEGVELRRSVDNLTTTPTFSQWQTIERWTPWRSLVPYLDKQFKVGNIEPMYRIDGDLVHIKGDITPATTIPNKGTPTAFTMFDNLPFKFVNAQVRIQVGSGLTTFALFTSGQHMEMQKYSSGGQLVPINEGGYIGMSGIFSLEG